MARIIVDSREPTGGVPRCLVELGIPVERRRLWVGDYEVGDRAIVERKTVRGLHAAVIGGTFWAQIGRMREVARFPYVLVEGKDLDDGPLAATAVRGVCVALMDLGVGLIRSSDPGDSALWLQRLADRRSQVRHRDRPIYAQRPRREARVPPAEAALAAIPGISRARAHNLLTHFGTLAGVVQAGPADWQQVAGIGPKGAQALAATFHTTATASRSRRSRGRLGLST